MPRGRLFIHGRTVTIRVPVALKGWIERLIRRVDEDPQPRKLMRKIELIADMEEDGHE